MAEKPSNLHQAYDLKTPEESKRFYANWAATYDSDFVQGQNYLLPIHVARTFVEFGGKGPVLDIGAGTGACGAALSGFGGTPIDATDISAEMLDVAASKDIYRDLFASDILVGMPISDGQYCGVVSSGTFTTGHVGPEAVDELVRVTKSGGLIAISIHTRHYESAGFALKLESIRGQDHQTKLCEVKIYGAQAKGPNKDDTAFIALIRKA